MTYNLTNISRWDYVDFLTGVNSESNGWLGMMILLSVFFIVLLVLKNYESKRAFASASFVVTVLSVFLVWIGLVQIYFMIIGVVMTAGSALLLYFEDG